MYTCINLIHLTPPPPTHTHTRRKSGGGEGVEENKNKKSWVTLTQYCGDILIEPDSKTIRYANNLSCKYMEFECKHKLFQ